MREMMLMPNEATMMVVNNRDLLELTEGAWVARSQSYLTKDLDDMLKAKSAGGVIFYLLIMSLALLAIFDTQVLAIFRRRKEIGTFIALGLTKRQVVGLFTLEGTLNVLLAGIVAFAWGTPLLYSLQKNGIPMMSGADDAGIPISDFIYPYYGVGLILATIAIVFTSTTIVSYLPSRKIAKLNPTEALRGKM